MRRPIRDRLGGQHAHRSDVVPSGGRVSGPPRILAKEESGRIDVLLGLVGDRSRQNRRTGARPEIDRRMYRFAGRTIDRLELERFVVRIDEDDLIVADSIGIGRLAFRRRLASLGLPERADQPVVRRGGDVADRQSNALPFLFSHSRTADRHALRRDERHAAVGHRCGTAAIERSQPRTISGRSIDAERRFTSGAVRPDHVQASFHLRAIEEVVRANHDDPAVGEHLRLVVEDDRVG